VRKRILTAVAAVMVVLTPGGIGLSRASAASSVTQGVTATTIRVGVPYIDVGNPVLRTEGVDIDYGSFPDAFNALVD
jgi:hypothetical protein